MVIKALLRSVIGHAMMLPFVIFDKFLLKITNRNIANIIVGRTLTKLSALFVGLGIPRIQKCTDFHDFSNKLSNNFKKYSLLYDVDIANRSKSLIEFRIRNCPFTSALKNMGASDLCKFACAGDFLIAKRNKDNWQFKRRHSHGTDGKCCDHTYFSLLEEDKE